MCYCLRYILSCFYKDKPLMMGLTNEEREQRRKEIAEIMSRAVDQRSSQNPIPKKRKSKVTIQKTKDHHHQIIYDWTRD